MRRAVGGVGRSGKLHRPARYPVLPAVPPVPIVPRTPNPLAPRSEMQTHERGCGDTFRKRRGQASLPPTYGPPAIVRAMQAGEYARIAAGYPGDRRVLGATDSRPPARVGPAPS